MHVLVGLPYSPWSEKARWALDLRRVPYRWRTYSPILGEPELRVALRRPLGTVSVPVLFPEGGRAIDDSLAIARFADARGEGPSLFPPEHDVGAWVARSERALAAGRARSLVRMLLDDEALAEMVPRPMRALGPVAVAIGRAGVARTLRKYGGHRARPAEHEAALACELDALRAALAGKGPKGLIFGALTFADVAMAQALAFVRPPPFGLRLGAASRRSFTDPELAERYADLLEWRDALYEAHRPR